MDSLNIDNRSKALAFKKFKCPLYKFYPKFCGSLQKTALSSGYKTISCYFIWLRSKYKKCWNIDRLLKNANVLRSGTGKNPTPAVCSETTKPEKIFYLKKTIKNAKKTRNDHMLIKVMQVHVMLKFLILLILNYNLKILN